MATIKQKGKQSTATGAAALPFHKQLGLAIRKSPGLYLMMIPGILFYFLFYIRPLAGLSLAFRSYNPMGGMWGGEWKGFEYFKMFIESPNFWTLFGNTLMISIVSIAVFFPLPIIFALLLNEVRCMWFKKTIQTVTYIPHFFSWVVIASISYIMFSTDGGAVNNILQSLFGFNVNFLTSEAWFRPLIVGQQIWRDLGWGTIVYLAAITSIDPSLYEAASMDGASRMKQIIHITLPGIGATIAILLILRMGNFMTSNFDQLFLMVNAGNRAVGDVFDTYMYETGIRQGQFSFATAVGVFKSVVGLVLVLSTNWFAKKLGSDGIM